MTTINMTTIGNKPTAIVSHFENINARDLYVQCRLPNGEDGYVSVRGIVDLVKRELAHEIQIASGARQEA